MLRNVWDAFFRVEIAGGSKDRDGLAEHGRARPCPYKDETLAIASTDGVTLGATLSGGLDSSLVVALACRLHDADPPRSEWGDDAPDVVVGVRPVRVFDEAQMSPQHALSLTV